MPCSDGVGETQVSEAGSEPVMTAVEVVPPSRHRWRTNPFPSYSWLPPAPTPPEDVLFRKDIEDDDVGIQALFESLTNRQTMLFIQQGLRTIIFVSFPLFTLANHPNTMYRLGFPQLLVGTVVSTSTHQGFLGKQIGMHLFILRGVVYMMLLGLFFSSWGVTEHIGAWWGLFAAAMFAANLVKHSILRRFMVLYTLIWMMEIRLSDQYFGFTKVNNSCWFAACFMIGSCMGVAAMLLPVPLFMHTVVDGIFAKTFTGLGKYLVSMQNHIFSPNCHAAENFFSNKNPLAGIEKVLAQAPSLLWFSNWEPLEFGTRNPIRLVKLSLLRRLLALTYAAQSCGENIVRLRREQADRVAMERHRDRIRRIAGRGTSSDDEDNAEPGDANSCHSSQQGNSKTESHAQVDPLYLNARFVRETERVEGKAAAAKLREHLQHLHANSMEYARPFGAALETCLTRIGTTENRPKQLVEAVPVEDLVAKDVLKRRNMRMETLFVRHCQATHIRRHRKERQEKQNASGSEAEEKKRHTTMSRTEADEVTHEPFRAAVEDDEPFTEDEPLQKPHSSSLTGASAAGRPAPHTAQAAPNTPQTPYYISPEDASVVADFFDVMEGNEVFLRLNELFFHLLLSMIAGEIHTFGEMMRDYKPAHSLPYRLWVFFIVEPWNDFWSELWLRLTLARPCDVRTIKNAVQMTAAYLAASAFNLELWKPDGVYYFFGTTIVLGMPVGEEALTQGVTRLAGNTLGCALGYLSFHNTNNLSESIGFSLVLCFICLLCQHHPVFGPCFIYGAIITLAGTPMAEANNDILQRVLSIAWAFCAFMLACMLIFPSSNIKILWNHRSKMVKILSEVIDGVADVARRPILSMESFESAANGQIDVSGPNVVAQPSLRVLAAQTNAMLSQLQLSTDLAKRMSGSCLSWGPIAARENMIRGSLPFPAGPSGQVQAGLQRLLAETQLLVFGTQLMHRPRIRPVDTALASIIRGPLADFLDEFSGMARTWSQGFIDSLQNSRRWSYPQALNDTSYLVRLKARLRVILFQLISQMNSAMVDGMCTLEQSDFEDIDGDAKRLAAEGASGNTSSASSSHKADNPSGKEGSENGAGAGAWRDGAEAHNSFASSIALDPNASFAGRYLAARRRMTDVEDAAAARAGMLPNDTMISVSGGAAYHHFAPLHDERIEFKDEYPLTSQEPEGQLAHDVRVSMLAQAKHRTSPSKKRGANDEGAVEVSSQRRDGTVGPHAGDADPADLEVANAQAAGGTDARRTVSGNVLPPQRSAASGAGRAADEGSSVEEQRAQNYHLIESNTMLGSAFRQMLGMDRSIRHYRPPQYSGPDFTYREDELDLPVDTDFTAVVCVLTSAYDMINEMQNLLTAMATINGYQRQLHEGSIAVDLIEKTADKIATHRAGVYERYHDPELNCDVKKPLSSLASPFHDFAV